MTNLCPICSIGSTIKRVRVHNKSWSGSPDVWLSGNISDLNQLAAAGIIERLSTGWYTPTVEFYNNGGK